MPYIYRLYLGLLVTVLALVACSSGGGIRGSAPQSQSSTPNPKDFPLPNEASRSTFGDPASGRSGASPGGNPSGASAVNCAYNGTPFSPTLGEATARLELESFDTCVTSAVDSTHGNNGGQLRDGNTAVFASVSGYWIGDTAAGESLTYSLDIPRAGFYQLTLRVQTAAPKRRSAALIRLSSDARNLPATEISVSSQAEPVWEDVVLPLMYFTEGPQQLLFTLIQGGVGLDYLDWTYEEEHSVSAASAVSAMGIGINLGNTLDAPTEGEWEPAAQRQFLEDFAEAGFGHVRIPVTWDRHVAAEPPYTIDPAFLARVEEVVDWALAQGLYVVLNAHHETWLKENVTPTNRRRFAAIWQQVAEHMQAKPARLIFEILNEPVGMTPAQVDDLTRDILTVIREHNPSRLVVFSGNGFTPLSSLINTTVPNDAFLIGNFHSYDPWAFAGQCTRSWGTAEDRAQLATLYQQAAAWSARKAVPVMVNEFGPAHYDFRKPKNICDPQARLAYLAAHVEQAKAKGLAATVWDDDGSFQIYHRQDGQWGPELKVLTSAP